MHFSVFTVVVVMVVEALVDAKVRAAMVLADAFNRGAVKARVAAAMVGVAREVAVAKVTADEVPVLGEDIDMFSIEPTEGGEIITSRGMRWGMRGKRDVTN